MPTVRKPGANCEPEEIHTDSYTGNGISGLPLMLHNNENINNPHREATQNSAGCTANAAPSISLSEGNSTVCGEDNCYHESYPLSPIALPSSPEANELCPSPGLQPGGNLGQVQCNPFTESDQQGRPGMVGGSHNSPIGSTTMSIRPNSNNTFRCIQPGLGSGVEWSVSHRGHMVPRRSNSSHKLPGVACSLPSNQGIWEDLAERNSLTANGQHYSSELHKPERGHSVQSSVPFSDNDLDLVHGEEYHPPSRAPSRSTELTGRRGVQNSEGSLRLEAEPISVPTDRGNNGSTGSGFVCITPDKATSPLLQLEARSRSGGDGCFHAEMVDQSRVYQSPVVPDTSLPHQSQERSSEDSVNNTFVENTTMVPTSAGTPGGLSSENSSTIRSDINATGARISDATGSAPVDRLACLRQSYTSRGISSQGSDLMLASWRDKTNSNYGSSFSKWAGWCQQRGRDPLTGPIEDVVNFLAKLYSEGYKYQSLNAYRSAISSTHEYVDGVSVGSHPTVTRLLQGAFNSRPPQPRYSSFWDVGMVIQHIKGLGVNKDLSLKQLTMKTAMLLALTRPSRSADLSKLNLQTRSFKSNGVVFRPTHLAKQSRSSRPMADFFFPSFAKDTTICPVATLRAYEKRTERFQVDLPGDSRFQLFLSWIGQHTPVSSSTIARWLKCLMAEAGVDISIFKAHSIRGASCSTAAGVGVTTKDILDAADWSSEGTFQKFYCRVLKKDDRTTFGTAVLSSESSSNNTC